jgi:ABC-type Fe3+ transport system substrate-binding protein
VDSKATLFEITEQYQEAIDVLALLGFDHLKDENLRKSFGKSVTLGVALKLKKIEIETFEALLNERLSQSYQGENKSKDTTEVIKLAGVLPCPIRVPLMEGFESWLSKQNFNFKLEYELKSASMGIGWLIDTIKNQSVEELPDLFISAGFELFFDKNLFGKYKAENLFEDITGLEAYHEDFHNQELMLKDPKNQYSILGVVPAVFLVNVDELRGRKIPESWEDILTQEFENSVSLPMADFDLFNAILLNIYKSYGETGIHKLGKSLLRSMHPAEMAKSHIKNNSKPVVTIMPYFFTKMVKEGGPMVAVWPKDGAIISPIFMLSKKEKKEDLKEIVKFFASKEVGEIFAHNGRFPTVHPLVDNRIEKDKKYMWLGWDYIKEHDISELIQSLVEIFNTSIEKEVTS